MSKIKEAIKDKLPIWINWEDTATNLLSKLVKSENENEELKTSKLKISAYCEKIEKENKRMRDAIEKVCLTLVITPSNPFHGPFLNKGEIEEMFKILDDARTVKPKRCVDACKNAKDNNNLTFRCSALRTRLSSRAECYHCPEFKSDNKEEK